MHFSGWRRGVCVLQMVMALGWGLTTSSASACSPPYPGRWFSTLGDSFPADGATDVLPEGLIRVSRRSWDASATTPVGSDELRHDVTVVDLETGEEVKGSLGNSAWGEPGVQYWKPESRLLPHRRYALLQSLTQGESRPSTAQGLTQARTSFQTGSRSVQALNVSGGLAASTDVYQARLCENGLPSYPCGVCTVPVQQARHGVWIQVPAIEGGFTFGTYRIEVVATQDTPHDFSPPASAERPVLQRQDLSSSGERMERFLELPLEASTGARVCVAWRVLDVLGNVREGAPVCLNAPPTPAPVASQPDHGVPADAPGYLGFGCSLGGAGLGPAALGLLALWRRRRPHVRR